MAVITDRFRHESNVLQNELQASKFKAESQSEEIMQMQSDANEAEKFQAQQFQQLASDLQRVQTSNLAASSDANAYRVAAERSKAEMDEAAIRRRETDSLILI